MSQLKKPILILLVASQLAGCASSGNQALLERFRYGCAHGVASDCMAVPQQERINNVEATENGLKAVAIGILLPLYILAAVADAKAGRY